MTTSSRRKSSSDNHSRFLYGKSGDKLVPYPFQFHQTECRKTIGGLIVRPEANYHTTNPNRYIRDCFYLCTTPTRTIRSYSWEFSNRFSPKSPGFWTTVTCPHNPRRSREADHVKRRSARSIPIRPRRPSPTVYEISQAFQPDGSQPAGVFLDANSNDNFHNLSLLVA